MINSVANIGGIFGPTILGRYGLWSMAILLLLGAVLAATVRPIAPDQDAENREPGRPSGTESRA